MRSAAHGIAALLMLLLATPPAGAREVQARMQVSVVVAPPSCSVAQTVSQGQGKAEPLPGLGLQFRCAYPVPVLVGQPDGTSALVVAGPRGQAVPPPASLVGGLADGLLLLTY